MCGQFWQQKFFGKNFTQSNTALFFKQSLIARKASDGKSSTSSYIEHISTSVTTQELREATKKGKKQKKNVIVKIDFWIHAYIGKVT